MSDRRSFLSTAALGLASGLPGLVAAAEQTPASPPAGARVPKFEFVYECNATLSPAVEMGKTVEGQRRIIPITGGTVRGPKIQAELLNGGWDWNLSRNDGAGSVEAVLHPLLWGTFAYCGMQVLEPFIAYAAPRVDDAARDYLGAWERRLTEIAVQPALERA